MPADTTTYDSDLYEALIAERYGRPMSEILQEHHRAPLPELLKERHRRPAPTAANRPLHSPTPDPDAARHRADLEAAIAQRGTKAA
ncbi:hypothetical protein OEIGOIKO_03357 [Streptomyces chrestomyceticus JCM 4735]|uniref:Uncharacterized protein n=1 Tax=Streptomyces chrestomyceticus JCM 4735 TaxID=1306181 RepID=A0A7U9KVL7_9ACTN|nr:hypothetical protein [Streptomyces chrestomyceticus]GCD35611.1 hypothetical protein OEIGOIKO_03357 [Streptomyces chrestomyceticus JCM 4735]